jgi:hypothetical protein
VTISPSEALSETPERTPIRVGAERLDARERFVARGDDRHMGAGLLGELQREEDHPVSALHQQASRRRTGGLR